MRTKINFLFHILCTSSYIKCLAKRVKISCRELKYSQFRGKLNPSSCGRELIIINVEETYITNYVIIENNHLVNASIHCNRTVIPRIGVFNLVTAGLPHLTGIATLAV